MNRYALTLGIAMLALTAGSAGAADAPLLYPMFQDHGVLQRGRPIPIWGHATPGEAVTVTLGDSSATAKAGRDGRWQVSLPPRAAGGPFTLKAKAAGGGEQTAGDVMVGDVYLCSGQSNMDYQVRRALDSGNELGQRANQPMIRYLGVERDIATSPQSAFTKPVSWQVATQQTVPDMSAVCYFFGREMRQMEGVAVGLIASSWGGSMIEAWMPAPDLATQGDYATALDALARYDSDKVQGIRRFIESWQAGWKKISSGEPWNEAFGQGEGWREAPSTFRNWESWGIAEFVDYNGLAFMRATINLTAEQAKKGVALRLGPVDDLDVTWVNGKPAGSLYGPSDNRRYTLPPGTFKAGANTVTVAIQDLWGDGGLYGSREAQAVELADGTLLPLDVPWQYKRMPIDTSTLPRAPWGSVDGLSTIHNAMLAPIGPYGIRAALWYQGESNAGQAARYRSLLTGLMAGWRRQFGADLPFLVVQLPEYGYPQDKPTDSGWAALRESQRAAVAADKNAAMAVTIGAGDWYDIHPANKQLVAKRLVNAARKVLRGDDVAPSGPVPTSVTRTGDSISIRFTGIEGALHTLSYHRPLGFELCGEGAGSCRFVDATLTGDTVTLPIGTGPAVRVRYCWADSPICNLYDNARLPAGPFEEVVK